MAVEKYLQQATTLKLMSVHILVKDPFSAPVMAVRKHSALSTVSKVTWKVTITKEIHTVHF